MGAELGRISGPLLAANLVRHGIDLAFENDLLYLDVVNGFVGIKTFDPQYQLDVNGTTLTTNLIVDTQATIADIKFVNYRIQNDAGSIVISPDQLSDPTVIINDLKTDNLDFSNRAITNFINNSNIELASNGMGRVLFNTDTVNVNGWLHATGNITAAGNIIIGNSDTDSVDFNADFASNINPDLTDTYDLGSPSKNWNTIYAHNLIADTITTDTFNVNSINLLLTPGNTWYVSENGSDTNYGNHEHSTFKTLQKALSVAQSGDAIKLFPGRYIEEFPLTVPQGVSVIGDSIRSVSIHPSVATKDKDAFLLNGETTIENLTVKDFYYNSSTDTGYAFRFSTGITVTNRSPYIRNCTVITTEDIGNDAGRGALVDGSVSSTSSIEAAMLFHAVTMIVSNADGITATNGARVEWLNSFTYYANRGMHLTEGTLGFAGQGVKFGAEMRSINSANVYGNYGAVADGLHTLGYLIGHNFGYVGTGNNSQNDRKLAVQANEVVAINGGKIYFDSVDHKGDFRIGDIFYVNQETGQVSFDAQSINFAADGNLVLESPGGVTFIDATQVIQTNIKIHDNNIDSLLGPVNIKAFSGNTYLNTNVFVTGNTTVSADVKVSGNVFLGNTPFDTVAFATDLTQTIKPNSNNTFTLGTKTGTPKVWRTAYLSKTNIDDILEIDSNTIKTISGGLDLQLIAAGTGKLHISSTDVQVDNNVTVNGTTTINGLTTLQNYEIVGNIHHVGNFNQTGNTDVIGDVQTQNIKITGTSYFDIPNINIYNNVISATHLDDDLVFTGQGSAGVIVEQNLKFVNDTLSNVAASPTNDLQKSIIFSPNGTGNTVINATTSVQIPVGNNTNKVLSNYGELRQNSTSTWYEGYLPTGPVSFNNLFDGDRNTYITPELIPGANDNTLRFGINGTVRATITPTSLATSLVEVDNLHISGNTINNIISGDDLFISPAGVGSANLSGVMFNNTTLTNTSDSAFVISITGTGYVKFNGTAGIVIPTGPSSGRRLTPEIGETRHNTTVGYMEVWNGTTWIPAVGVLGAAPEYEVLEIMDTWALILG